MRQICWQSPEPKVRGFVFSLLRSSLHKGNDGMRVTNSQNRLAQIAVTLVALVAAYALYTATHVSAQTAVSTESPTAAATAVPTTQGTVAATTIPTPAPTA